MKPALLIALLLGTLNLCPAEPATASRINASSTNRVVPSENNSDVVAISRQHWDDRVRVFNEQNLACRNVVLVGDSITEGFDVAKYFPGHRVLNRGISADVIGNGLPADDHRGVLRRLDSSFFYSAATDVFLLIGINDLGNGHNVEQLEQGYREILQRLHATTPSMRIHVESVLPTRGDYAKHNASVREFNERLRKLAAEFGCDYQDLHRLMVDEQGELKAEFTTDGVHLNDQAYLVWRAEIFKAMAWN